MGSMLLLQTPRAYIVFLLLELAIIPIQYLFPLLTPSNLLDDMAQVAILLEV